MKPITHLVWAPDDEGAFVRRGEAEPAAPPSRSIPPSDGVLGPTLASGVGDALPEMGPGEAADTGGMAIDPAGAPVGSPSRARDTGERARRESVPTGGQPDTFFDEEAERQYEREQALPPGGNLGGDIDHWRP